MQHTTFKEHARILLLQQVPCRLVCQGVAHGFPSNTAWSCHDDLAHVFSQERGTVILVTSVLRLEEKRHVGGDWHIVDDSFITDAGPSIAHQAIEIPLCQPGINLDFHIVVALDEVLACKLLLQWDCGIWTKFLQCLNLVLLLNPYK